MNGPENSASAMVPSATRGEKARDEIIVATMLLESCTPFRKSKHSARAITAMSTGVMNRPPPDGLQRLLGWRNEELGDGTDGHGLRHGSLFPPDLQARAEDEASASTLEREQVQQPIHARGDKRRGGYGQDPGGDDFLSDTPADLVGALGSADAQNRRTDYLRGAHRSADQRRCDDNAR